MYPVLVFYCVTCKKQTTRAATQIEQPTGYGRVGAVSVCDCGSKLYRMLTPTEARTAGVR